MAAAEVEFELRQRRRRAARSIFRQKTRLDLAVAVLLGARIGLLPPFRAVSLS